MEEHSGRLASRQCQFRFSSPLITLQCPCQQRGQQQHSLPPLAYHSAAVIRDCLHVIGGFNGTRHSDQVYTLNLRSLEWSSAESALTAQSWHRSVTIVDPQPPPSAASVAPTDPSTAPHVSQSKSLIDEGC